MIDLNSELLLALEETQEHSLDPLLVEPIDPEGFHKAQASLEEIEEKTAENIPPPSPWVLFQTDSIPTKPIDKIEPLSLPILESVVEQLSLIISHVKQEGIEETLVRLHEPGSLLHEVEICIKSFSFAPHSVNVEIKSCGKLQALLQKNQGWLMDQWTHAGIPCRLERIDFSIHAMSARADRISGTTSKKVTEADNQKNDDAP